MRICFLLLFFLLGISSFSQNGFNTTYGNVDGYARNIDTIPGGYIVLADFVQSNGFVNSRLLRLNSNGDTIWTKSFGNDSIQYKAYSMFRANDGGYFICGDFQKASTYPNMDSYLLKTDSAGNVIWFNKYGITIAGGGGKDFAIEGGELNSGKIHLLGWAKHVFTDSGNVQDWGIFQAFVTAFNSNGDTIRNRSLVYCFEPDTEFTWQYTYRPLGMTISGNRSFVCFSKSDYGSGQYAGTYLVAFDENLDTLFSVSLGMNSGISGISRSITNSLLIYGENYLAEMDTSGQLLWQTPNTLISVTRAKNNIDGSIAVLSGFPRGGMTTEANPYIFSYASRRVILTTCSATGTLIATDTVFANASPFANPAAFDFIPTYDSSFVFAGGIYSRIWAFRLDSMQVPAVVSALNETDPITVYPVPSDDFISVTGIRSRQKADVFSGEGLLLFSTEISENENQLEIGFLPPGIYLLRCNNVSFRFIRK